MGERRWSDEDRELVAQTLAARVPYPQHSQACRVWTLRPRGVKVGADTTPSPAALARCGCWVMGHARRDAAAVLDALTAAGWLDGHCPCCDCPDVPYRGPAPTRRLVIDTGEEPIRG